MMRFGALALVLLMASPALAEDPAMRSAANGFYGVYKGFHPSDGIPDAAGLGKYRPFLSDRLVVLMEQAGRAQAAFSAKNKFAPPLVEGDIFTSLFEGADTVFVGACTGDAGHGQCTVALSHTAARETLNWTDTIYLVDTPAGWRVDDIGYGGRFASGNTGRLSQTLGEAVHFQ